MSRYSWPGNIRELENFVCQHVLLGVDCVGLEEDAVVMEAGLDYDWHDPFPGKSKQNWPN
jgi:DNA-binding NtrC family response regulator